MTYYRGNEPLEVSKERFAKKYVVDSNGCFIWQGKPHTAGYGVFGRNGDQDFAHRYAWFFASGRWPEKGMFVCHSCDNPLCVNPDHLFLGTHQDNVKDAVAKNRMGAPHKLSKEIRDKILAEYRQGGIFQRDLAKKYNTSQATVSEICRGLHQFVDRPANARHSIARGDI